MYHVQESLIFYFWKLLFEKIRATKGSIFIVWIDTVCNNKILKFEKVLQIFGSTLIEIFTHFSPLKYGLLFI